ncbi:hypothetical protein LCGC14_1956650, partial [marine sediment metagenome]
REMNILRVFPTKTNMTPTDDMVFIGEPPMIRPKAGEVHISCTFTWDKPKAERLKLAWAQYYPVVKLGGPAYDDPCVNDFIPGMYVRQGIIYTSYGCNNQCPWCLAWRREGANRTLPIHPGNIIQDNNFLQCPHSHQDQVFDMLATQHSIVFAGGLEASQITSRVADRIRSLRIKEIFLACDTDNAIRPLRKAIKLLNLPHNKVRCYVLLRHNPEETRMRALIRLLEVYEAGALPFAQLYQPPQEKKFTHPIEWSRFARTWQRPAGTQAFIKTILSANSNGAH